ncbi:N-glycosyltransferase [Stieleria neptunia]|uniref:N-glycosyltransferase n=1 Tax=Stieleria neptunia TaxID=2527979 RepID=A0A518HQN3_9BACT|nr:glycosyltransferase [Stieleria neptunia]QDV43156.1 N-glycosyltransferase [Stieleria neptunia]
MTNRELPISIVIPTYRREGVLIDTIDFLLKMRPSAAEILVVDQSPTHEPDTERRLTALHQEHEIRWVRLAEPSIPKAMNHGLRLASQTLVLFLDDDITANDDLVQRHFEAHSLHSDADAVVGQVLQPGEIPRDAQAMGDRNGLRADFEFPFYSTHGQWISNVMAGNLSVHREFALAIGGFDENFCGSAFRFESEFARRVVAGGGRIWFCPEASIDHLRAERGGTRSSGTHLTSADPKHGIGDHYYAFLHGRGMEPWLYCVRRLFREVRTKFHLTHPWWIPIKFVGELRAFWSGRKLAQHKRRELGETIQMRPNHSP